MNFHSKLRTSFPHFVVGTLIFFTFVATSDAQWQKQTIDMKASLRGLSVVNEKVIWASGTGGTFLKTTDGGKSWKVGKVSDAEKLDFRDVEAFDANTAYLLSIGAGESSRIYKTSDGGQSWKLQFKNTNEKAFFDAFAFWDAAHGVAMSDPFDGKYFLIKTDDGGQSWKPLPNDKMPPARDGEAAFAASGTCLAVTGDKDIWFVTGGRAARVFHSSNGGLGWLVSFTQILNGAASQGIFSIAFDRAGNSVVVGGDYQKPNETERTLALSSDGIAWRNFPGLSGYRSGVTFVDKKTLIAVGSSGSDVSYDGGKTWKNLDRENYNAVQANGKNAIWAVGASGLVAKFSTIKN